MDRNQYHKIDHLVTGHAFDIQNEFGCFLDEHLYENELHYRVAQSGITCEKEVPVTINHLTFSKTYFLDLLVQDEIIYELKAVSVLNDSHRAQLINYLFVANKTFGKLINFKSASVQHEYITTTISEEQRKDFFINNSHWLKSLKEIEQFKQRFIALLQANGTRLHQNLYTEAMIFFIGGPTKTTKKIDIEIDGRLLGQQTMDLISPKHAFKITTASETTRMENNLKKMLQHTRLDAIHWININREEVLFKSILNSTA